jgi:hypothetical protein
MVPEEVRVVSVGAYVTPATGAFRLADHALRTGSSVFGGVAKTTVAPNSTRMSPFLHRFRIQVSRDVK